MRRVAILFFSVSTLARAVDFQKDIAPILEQDCVACHSSARAAGGLAVVSRQNLLVKKSIVPGNAASSSFYLLAASGAMPPGAKLSLAKLDLLKQWIDQGAVWPANVTLKQPGTAKVDEHDEVRQIRDRIAGHPSSNKGKYQVTIPNTTIAYDMVPIPGGDFEMGSAEKPDEKPKHKVHLDAFWMQAHEVTWDEYRLFMFANQAGETTQPDATIDAVSRPTRPYAEMSFGMGINGFPAISMTQHAANKYAEWLSAKTSEFYRLPTEAEWEYACRANSDVPPAPLTDYAWFGVNSNGKYAKVASKKPNAWGLFDMLGNVMEWTLDQYAPYPAEPQNNPWLVAKDPYPHAVRGGSWNDPADQVRCTARMASDASWKQQDPQLPKSIWYMTDAQWLGFRLVRPAKLPTVEQMFKYWNSGVEHNEQ